MTMSTTMMNTTMMSTAMMSTTMTIMSTTMTITMASTMTMTSLALVAMVTEKDGGQYWTWTQRISDEEDSNKFAILTFKLAASRLHQSTMTPDTNRCIRNGWFNL